MSRVDVVVPCYNYGRYLSECVESILREMVESRVLIIDDASDDDTEQVGTHLARVNPRVEFRRHPVNRGHIATYNEGLQWVSGEYHLLLSADDVLVPGALARATRLLDSEPAVGLAYGKDIYFHSSDSKPSPQVGEKHGTWQVIPGREFIETSCYRGANLVPTPTAVIRSSLLPRVGPYRSDLPYTADMAMWLRFAFYADMGFINAEQAYYRIHDKSMHDTTHSKELLRLQQFEAAFEVLFEHAGPLLPEVEGLRRHMQRALSRRALDCAYWSFEAQDVEACRDLLNWAVGCCPSIVQAPFYRLLRVRLLLGPRLWKTMRSVRRRFHAG